MITSKKTVLSCAVAAHLALVATAQAQDTFELEEVVVTANKREQSLQDIPTSITAMTGSMLADRGIDDPTDLEKIVPSMITGTSNRGDATINIRGVGYNDVGATGVAIHSNGIYLPQPAMGTTSQLDIARVEILRGPQSTLYGRNANGGVVNFITQEPTEELEGSILIGVADYSETKVQGVINVPLSEDWAARLAVSGKQRDDGFYENIVPGADDTGTIDKDNGARLTVAGYITDEIKLSLGATVTENDISASSTRTITDSYSFFGAEVRPTGDFEIAQGTPGSSQQDYSLYSATVDWDLGEWSLRSITALQDYEFESLQDFDFYAINSIINSIETESETLTQEFNVSGSIGVADSVFGLFYMDEENSNTTRFSFPEGFGPLPPTGDVFVFNNFNPVYDTESIALFADFTINVSDELRILAGIRYSEDDITVVQESSFVGNPNFVPCENETTKLDKSSTIGRLGAQYDVTGNSNVYGTFSQGVKTGGVNFRSGCQDEFEDEEITSYEIGFKTRSDDGTITANVTGFYYDYTDLQTQQIVGFNALVENAPGAEVYGLELDGAWFPNEHWSISGSMSFLDATYSESFVNSDSALPPAGPPPAPNPSFDVNGNSLNYSPDFSSNLSFGYTSDPILAGGTIDLRLDANYRSEVTLREFETGNDVNDPVTLIGVSAKWLSSSEDYSVRFYVDNATNEAYNVFASASNQNGNKFANWNTPRQYGIEFKAEF